MLGLDGQFGARLNINRVSDDNYWRDFTRTPSLTRGCWPATAPQLGPRPLVVSAGAYRYQTLQDVEAPIVPPYDRLPSLTAR